MIMTSTSAIPLISNGDSSPHSSGHSHTRSYQRTRVGSRLAPPFLLPRIPSERLDPRRESPQHSEEKDDLRSHGDPFAAHDDTQFHENRLIPAPVLHSSGELNGKPKQMDTMPPILRTYGHDHSHDHAYSAPAQLHVPKHSHHHGHRNFSLPTKTLLQWLQGYPLLHGILSQKDSRRIFYFMLLNLAFMLVQSTYGFLTGSLGLISDSIHMFFDCIALLMGICANVMSKWPANTRFPYGYGKIDTLAGFANGVFLMLISVEIVYEAVERLFGGSDLSRTTELLVVSSLGLAVNMVGILAFEHGHSHGHGGHSHSHGGHSHSHNSHDHDEHSHSATSVASSPSKAQKATAGTHHHGSENMQGIYLHIMADALGSVAVVVSTVLVRYTGWTGFDPLASCMIAILIFASAIPLVMSTATTLLLSLDYDVEYNLRDILAGISGLRGVVGYAAPKFWLDDIKKDPEGEHHNHHHAHDSSHGHSNHHHNHNHDHDHDHDSPCSTSDEAAILGVIHVIASQHASLEDVRLRTCQYLESRNMNVVVQVEREGEGRCWCGGGLKSA